MASMSVMQFSAGRMPASRRIHPIRWSRSHAWTAAQKSSDPRASAEHARLGLRLHEAQVESRLAPQEIIVSYRIPIAEGERSAYVKVRERDSYEYALVSAAAALRLVNGKIDRVRIALGSVAQRPWRLTAAEQALQGAAPDKQAVLPAIRKALEAARPLEHNGYKVTMAANAAARAIALAAGERP
jgi:xanthine dehydrogenase YagS FAD-binding subunit